MNGNALRAALALLAILGGINVALSGWALVSIVELKEETARLIVRVQNIEQNRFTDVDGAVLSSRVERVEDKLEGHISDHNKGNQK